MKIGLDLRHGPGLGDQIISTSLPENYFKNTGEKLIDVYNHTLFDFNPFIERNVLEKPDIILTNQQIQDGASNVVYHEMKIKQLPSIAWKLTQFFRLKEVPLRHPRLYQFEDLETIHNKVVIHTQGRTIGGVLSDKVMERIKINYKNYDIFQIGGKNDKEFPGAIDLRGLDFWNTAKHCSEAALFLGVDSAMHWICSCYPKVTQKIVLNYLNKEAFQRGFPLCGDFSWWEFSFQAFNNTEEDIGVSMSYLKI